MCVKREEGRGRERERVCVCVSVGGGGKGGGGDRSGQPKDSDPARSSFHRPDGEGEDFVAKRCIPGVRNSLVEKICHRQCGESAPSFFHPHLFVIIHEFCFFSGT